VRILWLYGPPAVGKSATAWELRHALAERDPAVGYVDIDQLGMSVTDEWEDADGHRLKVRALAAVAREFAFAGARTLVVSGVAGVDLMDLYAETLTPFDPVLVRLTLSSAELRRRLEARGGYAEEWAGVAEHARRLERAGLAHPVVQAGTGTPAEVAARVLDAVRGLADGQGRDRLPPAAAARGGTDHRHGCRAVLLGGTTAVGKSTIGWQAYRASRERGQPSAFADLRQLGFLGVDGGAVDHRLQARAAGALWQVFEAHGARLLILNGPVDDPTELAEYRTALRGTPVTAIRLTAQRSALFERVHARLRGEMAPLAGDALVGRPATAVPAIVDAALRRQQQAPDDGSFPSLDTTGLDPVESAERVLAQL
jgi:adenylylsulfate kinase-like enzyme